MARKKAHECPAGAPLWLATFADMATLLLAFFVMLLSFSSIQESKFNEAVHSLKGAFGVMQSPPTVIEQEEVVVPTPQESELQEILYEFGEFREALAEEGLEKEVELTVRPDGVSVRINSTFLFHPARAVLKGASMPTLEKLAATLRRFPNVVRVEGHTDNIPISGELFPSNWELSTARSLAVLRVLEKRGVSPSRLSAVGYAEHRPVAGNETEEGRRQNRRTEIFVEFEDAPAARAAMGTPGEGGNG